ncbi:MAG: hypothetical protein U1E65_30260 [Myxococcota bacterium]
MARPDFGERIARALQSIVERETEAFASLRPERILIVSGAARRDARASIRPLRFQDGTLRSPDGRFEKPTIQVGGVNMLYEICLRPRFFLDTSAEGRLKTLVHELWHVGAAAAGALDPLRRHRAMAEDQGSSPQGFEAQVELLSARLVEAGVHRQLSGGFEAMLRAWMIRPPSQFPITSKVRRTYDERDLFQGIVEIR